MKVKLYILFFCTQLCLVAASPAQNLEELLRMPKNNKLEEIKTRLPSLITQYPNKPELLYIQAFLETNGQQALKLYKKIVEEYSTCAYADDALFKIAQYYFALGLYINARKSFTNLMTLYPESPLVDEAQYFAARCLFIMGQVTSAMNELNTFLRNHSDSQLAKLARQDLKEIENYGEANFTERKASRIPSNDSTSVLNEDLNKKGFPNLQVAVLDKGKDSFQNRSFSNGKYALQIGAFSNKDNAMNQQHYFSKEGYPVGMVEKTVKGQLFYAVYLGNFETEQEAQTFGEEFKRKYGLSFRVVSLNP